MEESELKIQLRIDADPHNEFLATEKFWLDQDRSFDRQFNAFLIGVFFTLILSGLFSLLCD